MNMADNSSGFVETLWGRVISYLRVCKGPSNETTDPELDLEILVWLEIFSWCRAYDYGCNHVGG